MAVRSPSAMTVELPEVVPYGLPQSLWRCWWFIAGCFLLSISVGLYIASRSTPLYSSSARLLFTQVSGAAPGADAIPDSYLHAQADILTSNAVLNDAADVLGKQHLNAFASSTDLYGSLKQHIEVLTGKADGKITVSFTSPNSAESAQVVNTVVAAFTRYENEHFKSTAHDALLALSHQKQTIGADLLTRQRELQDFQSRNPNLKLDDTAGIEIETHKLSKLGDQLTDAQATLVSLNAKYDSLVKQYGPGPAAAAGTEPAIASKGSDESESDPAWLQNQLDLASANLEILQNNGLSASSPSVQDALASVAKLSKKLAASHRNSGLARLAQARGDLETARRRTADLQTKFDAQTKFITDIDARRAEFGRLQGAVRRGVASSDEVDAQIKLVDLSDIKPIQMHVLDDGRSTIVAHGKRLVTILIAMVIGLATGLALSMLYYASDQRLRSPSEIRELLRLPVLAITPEVIAPAPVASTGLIAHSDPMSAFADAARAVRSAVFFAGRSTANKTIVVTSAAASEGRSVIASNLAIAMAQAGSSTLLLDTNFRTPVISAIFEIVRPAGLSDVLSGKSVLDRVISRTSIERLEVLTCGSIPQSPAELLNSAGFRRLMEQLSARYQCIVLDSPPISTEADARILAATADLTVFVVRAGISHRELANQSLEQLLSVGAKVLGAVINGAQLRSPLQRSRGILRFVESPQDQQASALVAVDRSGGTEIPLGLTKPRMESTLIPDVEVVE